MSVRSTATCGPAPTRIGVVARRALLIRASSTSIEGVLARNALRQVPGAGARRRPRAAAERLVSRAQAANRIDRSARAGQVRL